MDHRRWSKRCNSLGVPTFKKVANKRKIHRTVSNQFGHPKRLASKLFPKEKLPISKPKRLGPNRF